jgi:hypothetical protein
MTFRILLKDPNAFQELTPEQQQHVAHLFEYEEYVIIEVRPDGSAVVVPAQAVAAAQNRN